FRVLAAKSGERAAVMIVNSDGGRDRIVSLRFAGLKAGKKEFVVRRIDREMKWDKEKLELLPTERREVDVTQTGPSHLPLADGKAGGRCDGPVCVSGALSGGERLFSNAGGGEMKFRRT